LTTENTYNIAINSSHIGFALNRDAYRIIAEILARPQSVNAGVVSQN
jgi:hypothetical protein